jgi:hypothetical protein
MPIELAAGLVFAVIAKAFRRSSLVSRKIWPSDPETRICGTSSKRLSSTSTRTPSTLPVLTINDASPEALETLISEQSERVSVLDSEGGGLKTLLGTRYGREGTSNLDLVLKAYSGSEPHGSSVRRR